MDQSKESPKEWDERQCIETFLKWCKRQFKTSFSYQRAEEVFPEIAASTRWDFIITQKECSPWYAVEIKRLIRPEARIQLVHWDRILTNIKNKLSNQLQGEYLVYGVPSLKLEKRRITELERVITELILQNAQALKEGKSIDLGSQILGRFSEWPHTQVLNPNLSPPIERKVKEEYCFTIEKSADTGCSIELAYSQSPPFIVEAPTSIEREEILQANTQLALAKERGASGTILLLDYHLPSWRPNYVKGNLDQMDPKQLSNIDCVYLVKVPQSLVSKVWGRNCLAQS